MYRANSSGILRRRGWPFFVISAGIVAHSCPVHLLRFFEELLAEGARFELALGLPLSLISSQVPSTIQPPFRFALIPGKKRPWPISCATFRSEERRVGKE